MVEQRERDIPKEIMKEGTEKRTIVIVKSSLNYSLLLRSNRREGSWTSARMSEICNHKISDKKGV